MRLATIVMAIFLGLAPAAAQAQEPLGFSGSIRGPNGEQMSLTLDGSSLRGSYSSRGTVGNFWGLFDGSLLNGRWSQWGSSSADSFTFSFNADARGLSGGFS